MDVQNEEQQLETPQNEAQKVKNSRVNWRVDDFCDAHGICRTTFYAAVKRGEIKTIKYGRRTLIPDKEAQAWQAQRLAEAGQ